MQYCAQVEHLHAQVAPDMPIGAFVSAINPQALGFQSRDQLYAPVEFAVQIAGPLNGAAGAIRVKVPVHANPNWLPVMKHRFAAMIGGAVQAQSLDFRTVDGRSISTVPVEQLHRVGKLHVFVQDKELRLPQVPAIPIEYSVTKMRDIDRWITDTVEDKLPALVARYLAPCKNAEELQAAVRGDGPLVKAIEGAIQGADRVAWAEFVRTRHVNAPVVMPAEEANRAAHAIASDVLLGEVRRMVEAAAPQIKQHFHQVESARIAKELTGRQNPDHYAPIAGLSAAAPPTQGDAIENIHEFYRDLAEDIVTTPHVREAISAVIYTRPMTAIGCRWHAAPGEEENAGAAPRGGGGGEKGRFDEGYEEVSPLSPRGEKPGGELTSAEKEFLNLNQDELANLLQKSYAPSDDTSEALDLAKKKLQDAYSHIFDGKHLTELTALVNVFDQPYKDKVGIEGTTKGLGTLWEWAVDANRMVTTIVTGEEQPRSARTDFLMNALFRRARLYVTSKQFDQELLNIANNVSIGSTRNRAQRLIDLLYANKITFTELTKTYVIPDETLRSVATNLSVDAPSDLFVYDTGALTTYIENLVQLERTRIAKESSGKGKSEADDSSSIEVIGPKPIVPVINIPPKSSESGASSAEEAEESMLSPRRDVPTDVPTESALEKDSYAKLDSAYAYFEAVTKRIKELPADMTKGQKVNLALAFLEGGRLAAEKLQSSDAVNATRVSGWLDMNQGELKADDFLKTYESTLWNFMKTINEILAETKLPGLVSTGYRTGKKLRIYSQRYLASNPIKSSIEAHHPWNAMIHHNAQPAMGGAYPDYYNAMHTKQDMTTQAPYIGDASDTYRAYHLFGGVPVAPLGGLERIGCHVGRHRKHCEKMGKAFAKKHKNARVADQADRDVDIARDSDRFRKQVRGNFGVNSELPPLVPLVRAPVGSSSSKAPPVVPISSKAPPVRPLGDDLPPLVPLVRAPSSSKAPPVLPIDCHMSDSDSDNEKLLKDDISHADMLLGDAVDLDAESPRHVGVSIDSRRTLPSSLNMPPLVPIGKKAPAVLPIDGNVSASDDDDDLYVEGNISRAQMLLGSMFDDDDDFAPVRASVASRVIPPCPPTIALIEAEEDDNPFGMPTLKQALAAKRQ